MFARFGGFGDAAMKARLARGERIGALLAQPRFEPLPTPVQIALLAGLDQGLLDGVSLPAIAALKQALIPLIAAEPALAAFRTRPAKLDDAARAALIGCLRQALARGPA